MHFKATSRTVRNLEHVTIIADLLQFILSVVFLVLTLRPFCDCGKINKTAYTLTRIVLAKHLYDSFTTLQILITIIILCGNNDHRTYLFIGHCNQSINSLSSLSL